MFYPYMFIVSSKVVSVSHPDRERFRSIIHIDKYIGNDNYGYILSNPFYFITHKNEKSYIDGEEGREEVFSDDGWSERIRDDFRDVFSLISRIHSYAEVNGGIFYIGEESITDENGQTYFSTDNIPDPKRLVFVNTGKASDEFSDMGNVDSVELHNSWKLLYDIKLPPNVEYLVSNNSRIGARKFPYYLKKLKAVWIIDAYIPSFSASRYSTLEYLYIESNKAIKKLNLLKFNRLKFLIIKSDVKNIVFPPSLTHLKLEGKECMNVLETLSENNMKNIRVLDVCVDVDHEYNPIMINKTFNESVLRKFPSLKCLRVDGFIDVRWNEEEYLHLKNVRYIYIENCTIDGIVIKRSRKDTPIHEIVIKNALGIANNRIHIESEMEINSIIIEDCYELDITIKCPFVNYIEIKKSSVNLKEPLPTTRYLRVNEFLGNDYRSECNTFIMNADVTDRFEIIGSKIEGEEWKVTARELYLCDTKVRCKRIVSERLKYLYTKNTGIVYTQFMNFPNIDGISISSEIIDNFLFMKNLTFLRYVSIKNSIIKSFAFFGRFPFIERIDLESCLVYDLFGLNIDYIRLIKEGNKIHSIQSAVLEGNSLLSRILTESNELKMLYEKIGLFSDATAYSTAKNKKITIIKNSVDAYYLRRLESDGEFYFSPIITHIETIFSISAENTKKNISKRFIIAHLDKISPIFIEDLKEKIPEIKNILSSVGRDVKMLNIHRKNLSLMF